MKMKTTFYTLGLLLLSQCFASKVETKRSPKLTKELLMEYFTIGNSTYYYGTGQLFNVKDGYRLVCEDLGMKHVALETEQEWRELSAFLISKGYAGSRFWSSGTKTSDGVFMWRSTNTTFAYDAWYPGEPNDENTATDICVYFIPDIGMLDNICEPAFETLCET